MASEYIQFHHEENSLERPTPGGTPGKDTGVVKGGIEVKFGRLPIPAGNEERGGIPEIRKNMIVERVAVKCETKSIQK
jgi:hypothetical protein